MFRVSSFPINVVYVVAIGLDVPCERLLLKQFRVTSEKLMTVCLVRLEII
jgi:hypothetical protein